MYIILYIYIYICVYIYIYIHTLFIYYSYMISITYMPGSKNNETSFLRKAVKFRLLQLQLTVA